MRDHGTANSVMPGVAQRQILLGGVAAAALGLLPAGRGRAQAQPRRGGVLRLVQPADAQPRAILAGRAGNNAWRHAVFDAITVLDGETGQPRAVLATGWESSDDGRTFVLQLRDDVRFHSGRAFTAEDVVFTLQQVMVPQNASQMAPLVRQYTSIEATGPHEVTIRSEAPVAPRIFDVFQLAVIVDRETFAGLQDGTQVIGTGPFKWDNWVPGATLRLTRNDDYFAGPPPLDEVEITVIGDGTAMVNALRGRADVALTITPRDTVLLRGMNDVALVESAGTLFPLGVNVSAPPFDNKTLRQAIGYAIDRQRIVDQVFSGAGSIEPLWWRPNESGTTDALRNAYPYDPDRARAMIEAAGAVGQQVTITILGLPGVVSAYEIVQNNLRAVGLNPVSQVLEAAAFDQGQTAGDLGTMFMQLHGLQGFSAATLVDALPALRDTNPSRLNTPEYRALKDRLQAATGADYAAALEELGLYMQDQAFSHVIARSAGLNAVNARAVGLQFDNVGFLHLHDAWLDA